MDLFPGGYVNLHTPNMQLTVLIYSLTMKLGIITFHQNLLLLENNEPKRWAMSFINLYHQKIRFRIFQFEGKKP